MAQSTYTKFATPKNAQVADSRPDTVITAMRAEDAVVAGTAVSLGTDPVTQVAVGASAPFGIVLAGDSETDTFVANDEVNVLRRGSAYVTCSDAFTAGTAVYALTTTGVIQSSATSATAVPNARFLSSGGAGDVAKIELDATGQQ